MVSAGWIDSPHGTASFTSLASESIFNPGVHVPIALTDESREMDTFVRVMPVGKVTIARRASMTAQKWIAAMALVRMDT